MKFSPKQREALNLVADGKFCPGLVKEDDGWHARWRAIGIVDESVDGWVDAYVREAAVTRLSEDAEDQKHETLHDAWMMALRSRTGLVVWDEAACADFAAELEAWSGSAAEDRTARREIEFRFRALGCGSGRLPTPRVSTDEVAAKRSLEWCGDAAGTVFCLSCGVPKGRRGLKALGQAAYVWPPLVGLRTVPDASRASDAGKGRMLAVALSHAEAEDFIRRSARNLRDAGYGVEGVDITAAVTAEAEVGFGERGEAAASSSGTAPLKLTVRVAGEPVTADEIRFLLDQGSSLVYFRDRWIEVDRGILKEALRALEKGAGQKANPLTFALGLGHVGNLEIEEVKAHGWLRGLVNELRNASGLSSSVTRPSEIAGFRGELRDYQRRGVEWLRFLTEHGFGALLADDMGLGKTIQVIAWVLKLKSCNVEGLKSSQAPSTFNLQPSTFNLQPSTFNLQPSTFNLQPLTLIVAPLTLLSNWKHEFAKFAPGLKVYVHQGENRHVASGFRRAVQAADVTVTSYNLLVRDYAAFSEVEWGALVLDEAQAVKNPDTQVARAVRALTPRKRIAMTGTPIENSVADIWSLEEFLNPGLLGERKSFADRFAKPIAADAGSDAAKRLHHALEPFVLRRLKSDPRIAAELGEKREIREYCELTPEQRRDYETALMDFRSREHAPGDVFALLTELKLVCDGAAKLERLCELVTTIFENGESALVFTQYAKVGAWLRGELETRLGRRFPFLHGSLSAREREEAVKTFQTSKRPNLFILSLKAGGFGLNLTKATHVIHFDRWWNPAVENQATDRAHRIGQTKTVFVHLFISAGTIEEHVDELLARKARVAGSVITEAEWLEAAKLDE